MGEIDEPHYAENQRQSGGEQGVETAEQHALKSEYRAQRSWSPLNAQSKPLELLPKSASGGCRRA